MKAWKFISNRDKYKNILGKEISADFCYPPPGSSIDITCNCPFLAVFDLIFCQIKTENYLSLKLLACQGQFIVSHFVVLEATLEDFGVEDVLAFCLESFKCHSRSILDINCTLYMSNRMNNVNYFTVREKLESWFFSEDVHEWVVTGKQLTTLIKWNIIQGNRSKLSAALKQMKLPILSSILILKYLKYRTFFNSVPLRLMFSLEDLLLIITYSGLF